MTLRVQLLTLLLSVVAAFAVGRFTGQKPEVKTEVTQSDTDTKKEDKVCHIQVETQVTENKDGTKVTTTKTDTVIEDKKTEVNREAQVSKTDVIPPKANSLNVSALAAITPGDLIPKYGVSVSKQILGPFMAGGFILTNGTIGISLGMSF